MGRGLFKHISTQLGAERREAKIRAALEICTSFIRRTYYARVLMANLYMLHRNAIVFKGGLVISRNI